jgi:hypothetical protein
MIAGEDAHWDVERALDLFQQGVILQHEALEKHDVWKIEEALGIFHRVLEWIDRMTFPQLWRETHLCLGDLFAQRMCGDPQENLRCMREHYAHVSEL